MKKTQRTLRKVAVAILGLSLVSLLTACAQSGDDPASIPSASSTPDSATSPATANPLVGPMEFTDWDQVRAAGTAYITHLESLPKLATA